MNATISIGDIQLTFVSGGRLRIDGGNMFGVIPRVLWERKSPPDFVSRSDVRWCRVQPGSAVVSFEFLIGLIIIHDSAGGSVPGETAAEFHRQVGEDTTGRRDVPFFDVSHRSLMIATRGEEIFEVPPIGRCGEQLSFFMQLVLRIRNASEIDRLETVHRAASKEFRRRHKLIGHFPRLTYSLRAPAIVCSRREFISSPTPTGAHALLAN